MKSKYLAGNTNLKKGPVWALCWQTDCRASLTDAVRLVEEVVAVAKRFLCVLVDRYCDRLDVLVEIEQPEKQNIEAFIARQDVSSDDLVSTTPATWGLFAARW
jgi:hypothetical protein